MIPRTALILTITGLLAGAQAPRDRLTLEQAEQIALKNNPRIAAAQAEAQASAVVPNEIRSAFYPTLTGNLTGAGAPQDTRIAAGAVNNPVIYSRLASGVSASQMITDFGRTSALAQSANLRASAAFENHKATRAETLLAVNRAYCADLRAQAIMAADQHAIDARQKIVDYISALAESQLKSELDVRFAQVSLAQAKLMLEDARNDRRSAEADLSMALGYAQPREFDLVDPPAVELPSTDVPRLIAEALAHRPEIAGRRYELNAARESVSAEKKLRLPSVSAVASFGAIPAYAPQLGNNHYVAGGLNIAIPFLNGGLYAARRQEAEYRAAASQRRLDAGEQEIARDVSVALVGAQSAAERIALSSQLLDQATMALELAQSRYDLGLSSIVELSQAQLAQTDAEIQTISAKYDYQLQRATLGYEIGEMQ